MSEETTGQAVVGLPTISEEGLQRLTEFRRRGTEAVMMAKEVRRLRNQIQGLKFGSVVGSSLSEQTQVALAEFCHITGANPLLHIDMMGGRPFLNANYWSDKLNGHPGFVTYRQRDISDRTEAALRDRSKRYTEAAENLPEGDERRAEYLVRSVELEEEADDLALSRAQWGVPAEVTHPVETTIVRFVNAAPLDKIMSGEIAWDEAQNWTKEVVECSWAGGRYDQIKARCAATGQDWSDVAKTLRPDPIGDSFPAKTARTRSLRRTASFAFSAWGEEYAERVERAEQIIQAEWEVLAEEDEAVKAIVAGDGVQVGGAGDVSAASTDGAREIPTREIDPPPEHEVSTEERIAEIEASDPDDFDRDDWKKRLFATLNDAGIGEDRRKAWAEEHGLPKSTKLWRHTDYKRAVEILVAPVRESFRIGCETLGHDPDAYAEEKLGEAHASGRTLREYQSLLRAVNREADEESAKDEPELDL